MGNKGANPIPDTSNMLGLSVLPATNPRPNPPRSRMWPHPDEFCSLLDHAFCLFCRVSAPVENGEELRNHFPVIDLFAGPGGLGEGFAAFENSEGTHPFSIRLAVEKDIHAHATLLLRCFFRQFAPDAAPDEYYQYSQGKISRADLFKRFPKEAEFASNVALLKELGRDNTTIYRYIQKVIAGENERPWVRELRR